MNARQQNMDTKNITAANSLHESLCNLRDAINLAELTLDGYFAPMNERQRPIDFRTANTLISCVSSRLTSAFTMLAELEAQYTTGALEGRTRREKDA